MEIGQEVGRTEAGRAGGRQGRREVGQEASRAGGRQGRRQAGQE